MLLHTVLCNMLQTRVCGHPVPREEFDKARPLTSVINNCFRASYTNMAKSRAEADRQKARINIRSQKLTWKFVYLGFTDQKCVAGCNHSYILAVGCNHRLVGEEFQSLRRRCSEGKKLGEDFKAGKQARHACRDALLSPEKVVNE